MFNFARRRLLAEFAPCNVLILLVLGGCTANTGLPGVASLVDPSAVPSPSTRIDAGDAKLAYLTCMRDHGIDDSGASGASAAPVSAATIAAAEVACRHIFDGVVGDPVSGPMDPAVMDQWLAWARCMRAHGVNVADPGGGAPVTPEVIDKHSRSFLDAGQACQTTMPDTSDGDDGASASYPVPTGAKP
jgi:hypothetical protein